MVRTNPPLPLETTVGKARRHRVKRSVRQPILPVGVPRLILVMLTVCLSCFILMGFFIDYRVGIGTIGLVIPVAWSVYAMAGRMRNAAREGERTLKRLGYTARRVRKILRAAGDVVITVDERGKIRSFNQAAVKTFGYFPHEVLGGSISLLLFSADERQTDSAISNKVGTGEAIILGVVKEMQGRRKNGTTFPIEPALSKIRLGRRRRYIYIIRDLTEKHNAEKALRQARDELETRVQQRTVQLKKAANRLKALSQQLLQAQELERRNLARELHDEIGQTLTAIKLSIQSGQAAGVADAVALVDQMIGQVRNLSLDLRPSMLDDFGLIPALSWYAKRISGKAGFHVRLADGLKVRLPPDLETVCYRVVQESLTNVVRHAQAKNVDISFCTREDFIELVIRDDGKGFDAPSAHRRATQGASLGLLGMQERVDLIGGRFHLKSTLGHGTEIRINLPFAPLTEQPETTHEPDPSHSGG